MLLASSIDFRDAKLYTYISTLLQRRFHKYSQLNPEEFVKYDWKPGFKRHDPTFFWGNFCQVFFKDTPQCG